MKKPDMYPTKSGWSGQTDGYDSSPSSLNSMWHPSTRVKDRTARMKALRVCSTRQRRNNDKSFVFMLCNFHLFWRVTLPLLRLALTISRRWGACKVDLGSFGCFMRRFPSTLFQRGLFLVLSLMTRERLGRVVDYLAGWADLFLKRNVGSLGKYEMGLGRLGNWSIWGGLKLVKLG